MTQMRKHRCGGQLAQHLRSFHQMHSETDSVGLRDKHPAPGCRLERCFNFGFPWIDRRDRASDSFPIQRIFEQKEPTLIKRISLRLRDPSERPLHRKPLKSAVEWMKLGFGSRHN